MQKLKNLFPAIAVLVALLFSSCLHIVEEATFHNNGSGSYKMTIDMSAIKGFMEMAKNMGGNEAKPAADSSGVSDGGDYTPPADTASGNQMSGLGDEISGVAASLKDLPGITNVMQVKDTANFSFGYSFDFANVDALNRALKIVNKEKFQSQGDGETFKFDGKRFERLGSGDIGAEMKKAMSESSGEGDDETAESQMDMVKMFLGDMSYKQIYHFPDRKVKKSSNKLSVLSDDNHTMTLTLLPFDEEQQKKKASVATKIKLK